MVIFLAVRVPIALKEVPRADLVLTVGAHEVLGVPRSAHGSHHLPSNRFLTSTADPFSHCLDAKFVEVRLQASQHVVQLVGWFGGRRGRSHSR